MAISVTLPTSGAIHLSKTLISAQTLTSTDTTASYPVAAYSQMTYVFNVTAASGTSPTLDIKVQRKLPDGNWHDLCHLAQITSATTKVAQLPNSPAAGQFAESTAIGASQFFPNGEGLGVDNRLSFTIGGTNPSFTFNVYVEAVR